MQPLDDRDLFPWLEEERGKEILEPYVQVAPGIYQTREDFEANMAFDEARDNEL